MCGLASEESYWSSDRRRITWFSHTCEQCAQGSKSQEHSERHQLVGTLPETLHAGFLRQTAGICVGALEMHGFGFVNTGLLNLGWASGLGELRSIIWQLPPILSGFKTLLIPYIVGGLF